MSALYEVRTVGERPLGTQTGRQRAHQLPHVIELTGPLDLRMAREDLLHQARTRARHAEDEDRNVRGVAEPAASGEEALIKRSDQSIDKIHMALGVESHVPGPQLVGAPVLLECPVQITLRLHDFAQRKERVAALTLGQPGAGSQRLKLRNV